MVISKRAEEIIKKGAKVIEDKPKKEWTIFNLRIPKNMIDKIEAVMERRVGISKTGWILEAIQEKLKRDE
jgi:hypothetical protein